MDMVPPSISIPLLCREIERHTVKMKHSTGCGLPEYLSQAKSYD